MASKFRGNLHVTDKQKHIRNRRIINCKEGLRLIENAQGQSCCRVC